MPNDIAKGKLAGFYKYLTKPLNMDHFIRTINTIFSEIKD